ncbi:hypothetical protein PGB90_003735 [Kerria lacca]
MPLNTQIKSQNVNIRFNFQKVVLPILKVLRLFGFAVFKINREGKLEHTFDIKTILYCIVIYTFCFSTTLWTQYRIIKDLKTAGSNSTAKFDEYLKIIIVTPQLSGPIPFLLQMKKCLAFLEKWNLFQLCIILYWWISSKAIQLSMTQYRRYFIQEVHRANGYTRTIEDYRLLWLLLCKVVRSFASSIGITITICLLFHIFYLILASYRSCLVIPEFFKKSEISRIPTVLLDSVIVLLIIFFYCDVGHHIPKLINIFLLTLSEYQPKVSVSGFYEINRSLFGGNEFNKRNVTLKRIYYYAFDEGVT